MARHRAAGHRPPVQTNSPGRQRPPGPHDSPRRAARLARREEARQQDRAERALRRARGTARRPRRTALPLRRRLLALPWVTFVLVALVAVAVVGVLRPASFEARSTVSASTVPAAAQAAAELTRRDLARQVEQQVELESQWRGSVRIWVDRPDDRPVVVVRAQAPDPRLAALAADTAAALVVEGDDELRLAEPAVVPTRPAGGSSWWPWALAGAAALALAVLLERLHERRERAELERQHDSAPGSSATAPGPTAAPGTAPGSPRRGAGPVPAGGLR